jgi:D-mannonate dehydratase
MQQEIDMSDFYITYAEWVRSKESFQTSPRNDAWEYQQKIIDKRDIEIKKLKAKSLDQSGEAHEYRMEIERLNAYFRTLPVEPDNAQLKAKIERLKNTPRNYIPNIAGSGGQW